MTAFALRSAAASLSTVEISGCGFPAGTARPISDRPSGVNVPGLVPPSSENVVISSNGRNMTSGAGVSVLMSLTMRPIPLDVTVTFVPVSFVKDAARSNRPAL